MKKMCMAIMAFLLILLISCETQTINEERLDIFDVKEASDLAEKYMKKLAEGDIEGANKYCKDLTISEGEDEKIQNIKINEFKIDEIVEGANHAYANYLVVRGDDSNIVSSLDSMSLRVIKYEGNYFINEIIVKGVKQVYKDNNNLRIIDEKKGDVDLFLRKKDLPTEVYPKKGDVVLTKEPVPNVDFNKIAIGFEGDFVAMNLTGENKSFIAVASVDESKQTEGESGNNDVNIDGAIDDALEKPICHNIMGYDLLEGTTIEKLLFSDNDGELIVQLKRENENTTVRVYKNPTGELLDLNFSEIFPIELYSLDILRVTNEGVYIKVTATGEEKENEGIYSVDIHKMKVIRSNNE